MRLLASWGTRSSGQIRSDGRGGGADAWRLRQGRDGDGISGGGGESVHLDGIGRRLGRPRLYAKEAKPSVSVRATYVFLTNGVVSE